MLRGCQLVETYSRSEAHQGKFWELNRRTYAAVDEADDLTCLFANVINIKIQRELVIKNDTEKFRSRDTELGFRDIGSEMIPAKLIMNRIISQKGYHLC